MQLHREDEDGMMTVVNQKLNSEYFLISHSGASENVTYAKTPVYPVWNYQSSSGDSFYDKTTQETLAWENTEENNSEMSEEDQVAPEDNHTEVAVVVNFHSTENSSYAGNFIYND